MRGGPGSSAGESSQAGRDRQNVQDEIDRKEEASDHRAIDELVQDADENKYPGQNEGDFEMPGEWNEEEDEGVGVGEEEKSGEDDEEPDEEAEEAAAIAAGGRSGGGGAGAALTCQLTIHPNQSYYSQYPVIRKNELSRWQKTT
jgi:hypothetical protein